MTSYIITDLTADGSKAQHWATFKFDGNADDAIEAYVDGGMSSSSTHADRLKSGESVTFMVAEEKDWATIRPTNAYFYTVRREGYVVTKGLGA